MNHVAIVAWNTFREAVRDRVLYNLVLFALLMIASAIVVGQISIGIHEMVIVSLGLSAISVIGLFIAVFIGVGLVSKEMDKRTLYALLAKPLYRWEFIVGKFGGLLLTLAVNTAAMAVGLFLALLYVRGSLLGADASIGVAVYFILLKLALVTALAMLFSCFTSPLLAILFTTALYISGLFVLEMRTFHSDAASRELTTFLAWLSYLLPNFENFNVMPLATHGEAVPGRLIFDNTLYAALYCSLVLVLAAAIFSRRNLK